MIDIIYNYKNTITNEILTWRKFQHLDYDEKKQYNYIIKKDLYEYVFVDAGYDYSKICQDIIKKCYKKYF